MYGFTYVAGDRAYLLIDPDDPTTLALLPLSFTGGTKINPALNRLDPLVLGPQLLHSGGKAQGTVLSASHLTVSNPVLAAKGYSKYHVRMHMVPEDGSPAYDSEQDITFTTEEKAQRMATVGAVVPVRYDRNDQPFRLRESLNLPCPARRAAPFPSATTRRLHSSSEAHAIAPSQSQSHQESNSSAPTLIP